MASPTFIGNTLAIQAIWKVVFPVVGDDEQLCIFLTNRAYNRGIPLEQLQGLNRHDLINRIMYVYP